jgi:hypothetical protein
VDDAKIPDPEDKKPDVSWTCLPVWLLSIVRLLPIIKLKKVWTNNTTGA